MSQAMKSAWKASEQAKEKRTNSTAKVKRLQALAEQREIARLATQQLDLKADFYRRHPDGLASAA